MMLLFFPAGIQPDREHRADSSQGADRAPESSVLNRQRQTLIRRPSVEIISLILSVLAGLSCCPI